MTEKDKRLKATEEAMRKGNNIALKLYTAFVVGLILGRVL